MLSDREIEEMSEEKAASLVRLLIWAEQEIKANLDDEDAAAHISSSIEILKTRYLEDDKIFPIVPKR